MKFVEIGMRYCMRDIDLYAMDVNFHSSISRFIINQWTFLDDLVNIDSVVHNHCEMSCDEQRRPVEEFMHMHEPVYS